MNDFRISEALKVVKVGDAGKRANAEQTLNSKENINSSDRNIKSSHSQRRITCKRNNRLTDLKGHLNIKACSTKKQQDCIYLPFACSSCPKAYKTGKELLRHLGTGLRYPCMHCGEIFTCRPSLTAHNKKQHSSLIDRPFKCNMPELESRTKKDTNEHRTIQTGLNPRTCGQTFTKKCNLNRHISYIHQQQPKKVGSLGSTIEAVADLNTISVSTQFSSATSPQSSLSLSENLSSQNISSRQVLFTNPSERTTSPEQISIPTDDHVSSEDSQINSTTRSDTQIFSTQTHTECPVSPTDSVSLRSSMLTPAGAFSFVYYEEATGSVKPGTSLFLELEINAEGNQAQKTGKDSNSHKLIFPINQGGYNIEPKSELELYQIVYEAPQTDDTEADNEPDPLSPYIPVAAQERVLPMSAL